MDHAPLKTPLIRLPTGSAVRRPGESRINHITGDYGIDRRFDARGEASALLGVLIGSSDSSSSTDSSDSSSSTSDSSSSDLSSYAEESDSVFERDPPSQELTGDYTTFAPRTLPIATANPLPSDSQWTPSSPKPPSNSAPYPVSKWTHNDSQ